LKRVIPNKKVIVMNKKVLSGIISAIFITNLLFASVFPHIAAVAAENELSIDFSSSFLVSSMKYNRTGVSHNAPPGSDTKVLKLTCAGTEMSTYPFVFSVYGVPTNWTDYDKYEIEMYNTNANHEILSIVFMKDRTTVANGYYIAQIVLDWSGWKTVEPDPLSMGAANGMADFSAVTGLTFNIGGWGNTNLQTDTELYISSFKGVDIHTDLYAEFDKGYAVYADCLNAYKAGEVITCDNPAVYQNGIMCVPLGTAKKLLDCETVYEDAGASVTYGAITADITTGDKTAKIGAYTHALAEFPFSQGGDIYLPLKSLCEIFGFAYAEKDGLALFGNAESVATLTNKASFGINQYEEVLASELFEKSDEAIDAAVCEEFMNAWLEDIVGSESINDLSDSHISARITDAEEKADEALTHLMAEPTETQLFDDVILSTTSDMTKYASRIYNMALVWGTYGSTYYKDAELLETVKTSLEWFYQNCYGEDETDGTGWKSTEDHNWYDWRIATPGYILPALMIIRAQLSSDDITNYTKAFDYVSPLVYGTGANYADSCLLIALSAALKGDTETFAYAAKKSQSVFLYVDNGRINESSLYGERKKYTPLRGSGFHRDGSYVFHTLHSMNGTYGISHITSAAKLASYFHGTSFEIPKSLTDNLARWYTESFDSLIYKQRMPRMVLGRLEKTSELGFCAVLAESIALTVNMFGDENANELRGIVKEYISRAGMDEICASVGLSAISKIKEINQSGNYVLPESESAHMFGAMDKLMHKRDSWALGVSMSSSRIFNYESINSENENGWYLSDGMTELMLEGEGGISQTEYWSGIDYYRLPGITADTQTRKLASINQGNEYLSSEDFVGGVTLGGKYSTAAMNLESYHNDSDFGASGGEYGGLAPAHRSDLRAKKSYFMFDEEIYCLGSGITASDNNGAEVLTVVDNRITDSCDEVVVADFSSYSDSDVKAKGSVTNVAISDNVSFKGDGSSSLKWTVAGSGTDNDYFTTPLVTANISALSATYPDAKINLRFYSTAGGEAFGLYYAPQSTFTYSKKAYNLSVKINGGWQIHSVPLKTLVDFFKNNTAWNKANINAKFDAKNGASGLSEGTEIYIDRIWIDGISEYVDDVLYTPSGIASYNSDSKAEYIADYFSCSEEPELVLGASANTVKGELPDGSGGALVWTVAESVNRTDDYFQFNTGKSLVTQTLKEYSEAKINFSLYSEAPGGSFGLYCAAKNDFRARYGAKLYSVPLSGGYQTFSIALSELKDYFASVSASETNFSIKFDGSNGASELNPGTEIYIKSIWISKGNQAELSGNQWLNLGNRVGYFFPEGSDGLVAEISGGSRTYQQIMFNHGVNPYESGYAYAILPNKTAEQTEEYAMSPSVTVLKNTSDIQAVRHNELGITSIVFRQAGNFDGITVSEPMIIMIKEDGDKLTIAASDPTQKLQTATLTIDDTLCFLKANKAVDILCENGSTLINYSFAQKLGASVEAEFARNSVAFCGVRFEDENGNTVNPYLAHTFTSLKAYVTAYNHSTDDISTDFYIAMYDSEGNLLKAELVSELIGAKSEYTAEPSFDVPEDTQYIRAFVWDEDLTPYKNLN